MPATIIWLQAAAPAKPAPGQPCNGCGVCCATAPCPIGMLASRRTTGACLALRWQPAAQRYRCGLLPDASRATGWLPWYRRVLARLVARWIGAGIGCDSQALAEPH
jgi:hypothetical protein